MSTKRIVALVVGCILLLPSIAMLFGGGVLALAYATQRSDDGYFDVTIEQLQSATAAITGEDARFSVDPGSPDWIIDTIDLDVRLTARAIDPDEAVFIGIARQADIDRYLADIAHERVIRIDDGNPVYRQLGSTPGSIAPPVDQGFWVAQVAGSGTQELTWSATNGRWAAVVMNADGSPGVSVAMAVGAQSGLVLPLALTLSVIGGVLTAAAVVLIVYGASGARRRNDPAQVGTSIPGDSLSTGSSLPPPRTDASELTPSGREVG